MLINLGHVNNVILTYQLCNLLLILKYSIVFKKLWKKHCVHLKEKNPSWEVFLGPIVCEPEHDSLVIFIFLVFWA